MSFPGFFSKHEYISAPVEKPARTRTAAGPRTKSTTATVLTCADCGFDQHCMTPRMVMHDKCKVAVVYPHPSDKADKLREMGVGVVEEFIEAELLKLGVTHFEVIYAIQCYPGTADAKAKQKAAGACEQRVRKALQEVNPSIIITVGTIATKAVLGDWVKGLSGNNVAGMRFPYHLMDAWVYPIIDTTDKVLKQKQLTNLITRDLQNIDWDAERPVAPQWEDQIEIITDFSKAVTELKRLAQVEGYLVFDYEANCLRPFTPGAKLACVGLGVVTKEFALEPPVVIPLQHDVFFTKEEQYAVLDLLFKVLFNPGVKLVAQNMPFEDAWSRQHVIQPVYDGQPDLEWFWCTMNGEHLLDERPNVTGLKFQLTHHYGLHGYDSSTDYYLRTQGPDGLNLVFSAPPDTLLLYCGLDVLGTQHRFIDQYHAIQKDEALSDCMKLFMDGLRCFCKIHSRGLHVDVDYYKEQDVRLRAECDALENEIQNHPDVVRFKQLMGREFGSGSAKDIAELFYKQLGFTAIKQTASGADSADKGALDVIEHPVAKAILLQRSKLKISGTYIAQFLREQSNGVLYPIFQLHTTETGRSSSANPNFQNIPKRDKLAQEICRRGIITPAGFRIFEIDYSGIEVKMAGAYTKDPVLLGYLNDESSDMHYDLSEQVFLLPRERITKAIRSIGKNKATFPWFYGSYFVTIARGLWDTLLYDKLTTTDGVLLKDHAFAQSITTTDKRTGRTVRMQLDNLEAFTEHIRHIEQDFWTRFKVFKQWQDNECTVYDDVLETENFFGFKRRRDLSKNMIINTPFQGTAFQALLWALVRCDNEAVKHGYRSHIVGQIHDAIVGYVHPSEEQEFFDMVERIMCHELVAAHPWINVPMDVELDASEVNGNWFELSTWVKTNGVWHPKKKK